MISYVEREMRIPSVDSLIRICDALGIPAGWPDTAGRQSREGPGVVGNATEAPAKLENIAPRQPHSPGRAGSPLEPLRCLFLADDLLRDRGLLFLLRRRAGFELFLCRLLMH